ncbi:MAG TPA: hypothetical protein DEB06_05405 [Phycisphaerales bacterium]|nr:hypothetical protein [Phycisphaerales bacterium]
MLVRLTDTKGRDHWINPIYIRAVDPRGLQAEVRLGFTIGMSSTLKIDQPAEQVAEAVSAALGAIGAGAAGIVAQLEAEAEAARQHAAMMSG